MLNTTGAQEVTGRSKNMDKYEFMERANKEVTDEEYAMIETVYLNHPETCDVGEFVAWFKKYGMKGVEACYMMAYHFDLAKQNIVDKQNEIRALRESVEKDGKVIEEQRRTIEYLAGLVDTADIINGLSKEALAAMIANKGVQA